jgi:hypothetical protein
MTTTFRKMEMEQLLVPVAAKRAMQREPKYRMHSSVLWIRARKALSHRL